MNIGLSYLTFGLQIGIGAALLCTSPYKNILGVCVHYSSSTFPWCEAQKYCVSVGGELVRGQTVVTLIGNAFPDMPVHYWIGLTDFLSERRHNRNGWRWTNGSLDPPSEKLPWNGGEPGNNARGVADCTAQCYSTTKLCDAYCNKNFAQALCQPIVKPNINSRDLEQSRFPVRESSLSRSQNDGCPKTLSDINLFDCIVLCRETDLCMSLFFHSKQRLCRKMLYVDANIYLDTADGWQKFTWK